MADLNPGATSWRRPSTPAKVAGTIDQEDGDLEQEPTETVVDGLLEVRGVVFEGDRFEMDDSRLTGTVTGAENADVHKESDFIDIVTHTLALRIENEAGSWSGQATGIFHGGATIPEDEAFGLDTLLLTGADAYEGLSAYLILDGTEDPATVEGVIFAGEMPPVPRGVGLNSVGTPGRAIERGEILEVAGHEVAG